VGRLSWTARGLVGKGEHRGQAFSRGRAEELLKAAADFDATWRGRACLDEFVSFARGFVSLEDPAPRAIRVLTIHASKGLDFDMVVLPDIDASPFPGRREASVHLHYGPDGQVKWGWSSAQRNLHF
jgi:ATP-dependent exoDNAse (exonuclease V) beta subunit